ncbi:DUF4102 domain-containing protein [Klebsiella sp. RHBSTW-00484]|nr:DUF4102 domain-containing protein [Klebsiella sp. RHBSTW-00465]QLO35349.1 DUF4102 domain-containing protein [Klebsiella sp. RHBSTW-00484]QLT74863.1 DUF4102 domain-containing protein [Klebsiella sp. RHBSTW-00464]
MPLTDLEIRRAKPSEKAYTEADGNGLSLQIVPNGSKGWRFRYRFEGTWILLLVTIPYKAMRLSSLKISVLIALTLEIIKMVRILT